MMSKRIKKSSNGFIVIFVLCMLVLLMSLLVGFNYKSRFEIASADSYKKAQQALNCARAGLGIAMAAIEKNDDSDPKEDISKLLSGQTSFDIEQGNCTITISQENGKINVNSLVGQNDTINLPAAKQLIRLIDILNRRNETAGKLDYDMVPAIIDWIDNDSDVTSLTFIKDETRGAESRYYKNLSDPYPCKNNPLDTAQEILSIKTVTPQNFDLLRDYITVYGEGLININFAPKPVLESLSKQMDSTIAQLIIDKREMKLFENISELRSIPGIDGSIYYSIKQSVTVSPAEQYYNVTSTAQVDNQNYSISAVLKKNAKTKNVDIVLYKEFPGKSHSADGS